MVKSKNRAQMSERNANYSAARKTDRDNITNGSDEITEKWKIIRMISTIKKKIEKKKRFVREKLSNPAKHEHLIFPLFRMIVY